jgi:hypothetical protein
MADLSAPPDLARWSLHCFCIGARSTPHRVVGLDNNGELLWAAVGGTTIDALSMGGLDAAQSQLWLLDAYGLIDMDGDHLETTFPVLGPEAVSVVRGAAEAAALEALAGATDKSARIEDELQRHGLHGHGFSVVFGHALDGVIWSLLRFRGGIPDVTPDIANPLWKGAFWALYPGRPGSAGTNELVGEGATLVMVWDDDSIEALRALAARSESRNGLVTVDREAPRHVIGDVGPVPVVEGGDVLDSLSREMAGLVVEEVPTPDDCKDLLESAGVHSTVEEATVIVAHEVIWALADLLAGAGVVPIPKGPGVEGRLFVRVDR